MSAEEDAREAAIQGGLKNKFSTMSNWDWNDDSDYNEEVDDGGRERAMSGNNLGGNSAKNSQSRGEGAKQRSGSHGGKRVSQFDENLKLEQLRQAQYEESLTDDYIYRLRLLAECVETFIPLKKNKYLERKRRQIIANEAYVCQCKIPTDRKNVKSHGHLSFNCGDRCINKCVSTECLVQTCPTRSLCQNRRFQLHQNAYVYPIKTSNKAWGLAAGEPIKKGTFIMQYTGEVLSTDSNVGIERILKYKNSTCTYLMRTSENEVIDPSEIGNLARLINHSCDPNCETQKWNVLGEICVGIFSLKDIAEDEELTFDYQFDCYQTPFTRCYCGTKKCKGYLGILPTKENEQSSSEPQVCGSCNEKIDRKLAICEHCHQVFHQNCVWTSQFGSFSAKDLKPKFFTCSNCESKKEEEEKVKIKNRRRKKIDEEGMEGSFDSGVGGQNSVSSEPQLTLIEGRDKAFFEAETEQDKKIRIAYQRLLNKAVRRECQVLEADFKRAKEEAMKTKSGISAGFNFHEYCDSYNFQFELWKRLKSKIKCKRLMARAKREVKSGRVQDSSDDDLPSKTLRKSSSQRMPRSNMVIAQKGFRPSEMKSGVDLGEAFGTLHELKIEDILKPVGEEPEQDNEHRSPFKSRDDDLMIHKYIDEDDDEEMEEEGYEDEDQPIEMEDEEEPIVVHMTDSEAQVRGQAYEQSEDFDQDLIEDDEEESKGKADDGVDWLGEKLNDLNDKLKKRLNKDPNESSDEDAVERHYRTQKLKMITDLHLKIIRENLAILSQFGAKLFWDHTQQQNIHHLPQANKYNIELKILGTSSQVRNVSEVIQILFEEQSEKERLASNFTESKYIIPRLYIRKVIGYQEKNLSSYRQRFSIDIDYDKTLLNDDVYPLCDVSEILISGPKKGVDAVIELIEKQILDIKVVTLQLSMHEGKSLKDNISHIKNLIDPAEMRIKRQLGKFSDDGLRELNHPFYFIPNYTRDVLIIGTTEEALAAEKIVLSFLSKESHVHKIYTLSILLPNSVFYSIKRLRDQLVEKYSNPSQQGIGVDSTQIFIYEPNPPRKHITVLISSTWGVLQEIKNEILKETRDQLTKSDHSYDMFQYFVLHQQIRFTFKCLKRFLLENGDTSHLKHWDLVSEYVERLGLKKMEEKTEQERLDTLALKHYLCNIDVETCMNVLLVAMANGQLDQWAPNLGFNRRLLVEKMHDALQESILDYDGQPPRPNSLLGKYSLLSQKNYSSLLPQPSHPLPIPKSVEQILKEQESRQQQRDDYPSSSLSFYPPPSSGMSSQLPCRVDDYRDRQPSEQDYYHGQSQIGGSSMSQMTRTSTSRYQPPPPPPPQVDSYQQVASTDPYLDGGRRSSRRGDSREDRGRRYSRSGSRESYYYNRRSGRDRSYDRYQDSGYYRGRDYSRDRRYDDYQRSARSPSGSYDRYSKRKGYYEDSYRRTRDYQDDYYRRSTDRDYRESRERDQRERSSRDYKDYPKDDRAQGSMTGGKIPKGDLHYLKRYSWSKERELPPTYPEARHVIKKPGFDSKEKQEVPPVNKTLLKNPKFEPYDSTKIACYYKQELGYIEQKKREAEERERKRKEREEESKREQSTPATKESLTAIPDAGPKPEIKSEATSTTRAQPLSVPQLPIASAFDYGDVGFIEMKRQQQQQHSSNEATSSKQTPNGAPPPSQSNQ